MKEIKVENMDKVEVEVDGDYGIRKQPLPKPT